MYTCVHVCVPSLYSYINVCPLYATEQIWLPHGKMRYTVIMLHGHIDPTFCIDVPKHNQPTIYTSHVNAMYRPATNMPLTCHTCK